MDLKQEPSNLHEWVVKTEPDVDTGQTEQPFKNFESKCEYSASEHIVNVSQIKEETNECIVPKIEYQEKIDCDSIQFVSGTIKKELDVRDLVNISEIKQEVSDSEYIQAKTERELLNTDCDLPTLKNESAEYSDIILQPCSSKYAEKTLKTIRNVISNKKKKKKLYPCLVCQKNFSSSKSRSKHTGIHFGKKFIVCEFCGLLMTKIDFFLHYFIHLVKTKSSKVSPKIIDAPRLQEKLKIHTNKKPFDSNTFYKQFNREYHLISHTNDKSFKCDVCFKAFTQHSYLKQHLKTHTSDKPFKCDICSKAFNRKARLKEHLIIHTNEKPFKCNFCPKEFNKKYSLQRHLISHTDETTFNFYSNDLDSEKLFKCNICLKEFNKKYELTRHLIIHTDIRPFKCDICLKGFKRNDELQGHSRVHAVEKPFECNICSKKFKRKSYLNPHLIIHTNEKPFKCDLCPKRFKRIYEIQRHSVIHSEETPFKCDVCPKEFKRNVDLLNHLLTHTDNNNIKCDICSKLFTRKTLLQQHLRKKHNIR